MFFLLGPYLGHLLVGREAEHDFDDFQNAMKEGQDFTKRPMQANKAGALGTHQTFNLTDTTFNLIVFYLQVCRSWIILPPNLAPVLTVVGFGF